MAAGEVEGAGGTSMGIGTRLPTPVPGIPCGAAGGGGFITALLTKRERKELENKAEMRTAIAI